MADEDKARSARERLAAAKAAAEDAEVAAETPPVEGEAARTTEPAGAPEPGASPEAEAKAGEGEGTEAGPAPEPEPEPDPRPEPEPEEHSEPEEKPAARAEKRSEEERRPISVLILQALSILFVGGALALWAGPRIAPSLPGWAAPLAAFLTPGERGGAEEMLALRAELDAAVSALSARIDAAEAEAAPAEALAALEAKVAAMAASDPAPAPATDPALEARITEAEAAVEALRGALSAQPSPGEETDISGLAAFDLALSSLREDIDAAIARAEAQAEAFAPLETRVAALESGEAATAGARDEAETIRRRANLDAAMTRIGEALLTGAPFDRALTQAIAVSGSEAPAPLAAYAEAGAPTPRGLVAAFPAEARSAYAAAVEAEAGEGFGESLVARLAGRIGGRPATETEGPGAGAVLSRIEARLREGRLAAAAEEAASLPEPAAAAMAGWIESLKGAVAAAGALAGWRDEAAATLGG